jgi:transcriptional regulator with XRE-family HTH domain
MNRYENGSVTPKYNLVLKLAESAGLPEYFFYIQDDAIAESLLEAVKRRGSWTVDLSDFSPRPS